MHINLVETGSRMKCTTCYMHLSNHVSSDHHSSKLLHLETGSGINGEPNFKLTNFIPRRKPRMTTNFLCISKHQSFSNKPPANPNQTLACLTCSMACFEKVYVTENRISHLLKMYIFSKGFTFETITKIMTSNVFSVDFFFLAVPNEYSLIHYPKPQTHKSS